VSFNVHITHLTGLNYVSRPPLARSDDLGALPGSERAANVLFAAYVSSLPDKQRKEFIGAFDYALVEVVQAGQRPLDDRLRGTLDRIVLTAPRLALVAGVAMIGLDIYFRNRGAETPRQYVLRLGEMIIKEWETLQEPAA